MLNSYFLNGAKSEQSLIQSLVNEQLRMYGVEVYYIPRKYSTTNTVIREVIESKFDSAYPIEAYVDSYEGYGGQGTLLSKFGIEDRDDLTLIISKFMLAIIGFNDVHSIGYSLLNFSIILSLWIIGFWILIIDINHKQSIKNYLQKTMGKHIT